jgi:type IV secretory pathway VirB10-like protein
VVVDKENPWGYREPTPTKDWGSAMSSEERKKKIEAEGVVTVDNVDDDVESLPSPFKKEDKFVLPDVKPVVSADDVKQEPKADIKPARRVKKEKRARSSSSSSDSSTESDSSSDRRRRRKEKKHVARVEKKEKKQAASLQKQIDNAVADGKSLTLTPVFPIV